MSEVISVSEKIDNILNTYNVTLSYGADRAKLVNQLTELFISLNRKLVNIALHDYKKTHPSERRV